MSSSGPEQLFLGLDLSTQQLKAIIISGGSTLIHECAVHFDKDLPQYKTISGAVLGPGSGEVTSPVAMWLDAIDLLMERMKQAGVDLRSISAISGAGQVRPMTQLTTPHAHLLSNMGQSTGRRMQKPCYHLLTPPNQP
jgi:xylulokinase